MKFETKNKFLIDAIEFAKIHRGDGDAMLAESMRLAGLLSQYHVEKTRGLSGVFQAINSRYFDGEIPHPLILLMSPPDGHRGMVLTGGVLMIHPRLLDFPNDIAHDLIVHECLHLLELHRWPTDDLTADREPSMHTCRTFRTVVGELAARLKVPAPTTEAAAGIFPVTRADLEALGVEKLKELMS